MVVEVQRVLVVAADAVTHERTRTIGEQEGIEVLDAYDRDGALALATHHTPSVILCGWIADGDALLTIAELRRIVPAATITVLIGPSHMHDEQAARQAGADEVLVHPLDQAAVRAAIRPR